MNTKFTLGFAIITGKQNRGLINDKFEIIRLGADIKLECQGCGRIIMLASYELDKRIKK